MGDFERLKKRALGFPEMPGVYTMRDASGKILYIGKAGNLRRRVSSYFLKAHDARIERLMQEVREIEYEETDTALEALILEAKRIKEHHPLYNIREQDDKSFLYVAITREAFPRVLLVRGKDMGRLNLLQKVKPSRTFGPFASAASIREALRILRRIFPWSTHTSPNPPLLRGEMEEGWDAHSQYSGSRTAERGSTSGAKKQAGRPCFDHEVGLCPGTCVGAADKREYRKNVRRLVGIFEGKKNSVVRELEREMEKASKALEFETAAKLRKQIFALRHVQDVALLRDEEFSTKRLTLNAKSYRIEGYDISNISGTSAVGSMVVFMNGEPDKSEYRKFKIKTVAQSDDVGMLKEVLRRRFRRYPLEEGNSICGKSNRRRRFDFQNSKSDFWALPNLILVDGGRGQVNAAREVLNEVGLKVPVVGVAKGPKRKWNDIIGNVPAGVSPGTLVKVRDEAHRFAVAYHKKLRGRNFLV
jgi:excinuclease ABC subunit C